MLSKFFKFILFDIILLLSFLTLFAFFIKFFILNDSFYAYSFKRNDVYKNLSKGIKSAAKEFLIGQLSSSEDYSSLSLGKRQEIDKQVEAFTSFINEEAVNNFIGTNIVNILAYLNNKSDQIYLYLPIDDWDLPNNSFNQIPDYLKTTNVNILDILKNSKQDTAANLQTLAQLKFFSKYTNLSIFSGIALQIFMIFIYSLFSKKGTKYQSIGKLFSLLGVIILILSWIFFTAQKIFSEGLAFKTGWSEILAGTLVPIFAKPLVIVLTIYGLFILITGIILYNKESKNQLVNKANLR